MVATKKPKPADKGAAPAPTPDAAATPAAKIVAPGSEAQYGVYGNGNPDWADPDD